jgi:ribosomal protein S18 acetylase RimI-like enzyme
MPSFPAFSVRPSTDADTEFLNELYASTRADELEMAGFPIDQRAEFCRSQFSLRQHHYKTYFPDAIDHIIVLDGLNIGRELISFEPKEIMLMDIALLPIYRGLGLGSELLRRLIARSKSMQLPIRLHADQGSRAQALYERHGFVIIEDQMPHWHMERKVDVRTPNA